MTREEKVAVVSALAAINDEAPALSSASSSNAIQQPPRISMPRLRTASSAWRLKNSRVPTTHLAITS